MSNKRSQRVIQPQKRSSDNNYILEFYTSNNSLSNSNNSLSNSKMFKVPPPPPQKVISQTQKPSNTIEMGERSSRLKQSLKSLKSATDNNYTLRFNSYKNNSLSNSEIFRIPPPPQNMISQVQKPLNTIKMGKPSSKTSSKDTKKSNSLNSKATLSYFNNPFFEHEASKQTGQNKANKGNKQSKQRKQSKQSK